MRYYLKMMLLCYSFFSCSVSFAELRDPTRPVGYVEKQTEEFSSAWNLSAIVIASDRKFAVINNQIVKVGDELTGTKVLSIEPNSVQLEGSQGKITLFLLDTSVLKQH